MYKLIDTHAHLEMLNDIEGAISRAKDAGVLAIVAVGSDSASNKYILDIAEKHYPIRIYPAFGVHPWAIDNYKEEDIDFIEKNLDKAVAIGEIGLDYWLREIRKDENKKKKQKEVFEKQLRIARSVDKPIIVHSRGAWDDCYNIIANAKIKKAVFHWFSGSIALLDELVSNGFFISATPAAAYSKEHRSALKKASLENILLETDSPVPYKGKDTEPADIVKSLKALAELKNVSLEEIANKTTENALEFFGISL
ncbi:MAG: TatD family hydrolase [Candidatus Thermoplasmatota archaeon]